MVVLVERCPHHRSPTALVFYVAFNDYNMLVVLPIRFTTCSIHVDNNEPRKFNSRTGRRFLAKYLCAHSNHRYWYLAPKVIHRGMENFPSEQHIPPTESRLTHILASVWTFENQSNVLARVCISTTTSFYFVTVPCKRENHFFGSKQPK